MSIAKKLFAAAGSMIALLIIVSMISSLNSYMSRGSISQLVRQDRHRAIAYQVMDEVFETRMLVWRSLATGDAQYWNDADKPLSAALEELRALIRDTQSVDRKAKGKAIASLFSDYQKALGLLRGHGLVREANYGAEERGLLDSLARTGGEIVADLRTLSQLYADAAQETEAVAAANFDSTLTLTLALNGGGIALAAALSGIIIASIRRPIGAITATTSALAKGDYSIAVPHVDEHNEIGEMARSVDVLKAGAIERQRLEAERAAEREATERERERIASERARRTEEQAEVVRRLGVGLRQVASGDLTARLDDGIAPQFAAIRDDFNASVVKLAEMIEAVVAAIQTIEAGSQEILTASDDLARRAEQQAGTLEESSAAMKELAAVVSRTADASTKTKDIISSANTETTKSIGVVRKAEQAIERIKESSEKIGAIIGVIDEIAFQTNLLALNAGVEAARAGEAGRGFAVVASEVRALAQRSAQAAKEIKDLISRSGSEVVTGVELVKATGSAFDRVKGHIAIIDSGIRDIANRTVDQSTTLKQVNVAISEIDQATQQNAAMSEESSAACQSLTQECERLAQMFGKFQLTDVRVAGIQAPAPSRRHSPSSKSAARNQQLSSGSMG
jgi:methyl-accepting chemotaxis protein